MADFDRCQWLLRSPLHCDIVLSRGRGGLLQVLGPGCVQTDLTVVWQTALAVLCPARGLT